MTPDPRVVSRILECLLKRTLERLNLDDNVPSPEAWPIVLEVVRALIEDREAQIEALEERIASAKRERAQVLRSAAGEHADVIGMIEAMTSATGAFQHAVTDYDPTATLDDALRIARHRFTRRVDEACGPDPGGDENSGDRQPLRDGLRELGRAMAEIVGEVASSTCTSKELELAGALQQLIVPAEAVDIPGLALHAWFQPAAECGGDWWSAHALSPSDGLVVLGDVTGHGAPAAIVAGAVKGACDLARLGMRSALKPSQLLRMLNRVIRESATASYLMTGVAVRVAQGGGVCAISNAGHRPPLLIHRGEIAVLHGERDPPLGAAEAHVYREQAFEAAPGDLLLLYTDGVTEVCDGDGVELGDRAIRALAREGADLGARGLRDRIRQRVIAHRGGVPQHDDICLVVGEFA